MKFFLSLILICFSFPSFSQSLSHTVQWEKGVNKKLIKEWIISLDKVSTVSSTTYISKKSGGKDSLHKNGHRDLIVWIPKNADLQKNLTVIIWFHGHWGFVPKRTFEDRTLRQLTPLASSKNFVLVIPEMPWSVHTSTPTKRNSRLWLKPGDFIKFVNQAKKILNDHLNSRGGDDSKTKQKLGKIDYRIVGHSAGGSTIKRISITGDLCKIKPSLVVWSDSSYGTWLRESWDGCLEKHRDIKVKVFVSKGDYPWLRATQFMGEFQGPIDNLKLYVMKKPRWTHKAIGDNIVEISDLLEDLNL